MHEGSPVLETKLYVPRVLCHSLAEVPEVPGVVARAYKTHIIYEYYILVPRVFVERTYGTSTSSGHGYECPAELTEVIRRVIPAVNTAGMVCAYRTEHDLGYLSCFLAMNEYNGCSVETTWCIFICPHYHYKFGYILSKSRIQYGHIIALATVVRIDELCQMGDTICKSWMVGDVSFWLNPEWHPPFAAPSLWLAVNVLIFRRSSRGFKLLITTFWT